MDVKRPRPSRRWGRLGLAVVLGSLLVASFAAATRAEPASVRVERDKLWTATVQRGVMRREVRAQGRLVPLHVRLVTVLSPGRVETRAVEAGDEVSPGAALFELSNPQLRLELAQARAAVSAARVQALAAKRSRTHTSFAAANEMASRAADHEVAGQTARAADGLGARGLVPELERREAEARLHALGKQVALDRGQAKQLQRNDRVQARAEQRHLSELEQLVDLRAGQLGGLSIRAPLGGIVQDVDVQEGQWVVPGDVLAKVADPTELKAVLEIPGSQARDLALGQPAAIEMAATTVPGRVTRVAPSVQEGFVRVEVQLQGPLPSGARPELLVHGSIEVERIPDALFVERPANAAANEQASIYVVGDDDNSALARSIRFGRISAQTIEIRDGAVEGDTLIVSDMSKYAAHERVQLQ